MGKNECMDKRLKKIYLRTYRRGRNPAAYYIDRLFLLAITVFAVYLAARPQLQNRTICTIVSLFVALTVFIMLKLTDERRLARHINKLRSAAAQQVIDCKLMLMEPDALSDLINPDREPSVIVHSRAECVTADDVRHAFIAVEAQAAPNVIIVAYSKPTEAAKRMIKQLNGSVSVQTPQEYAKDRIMRSISVSEDEIDAQIIAAHEKKRDAAAFVKSLKLLSKQRALRYLGVGALLMLCSFYMRYSLYFRLLSTLCISVGGGIFVVQEIRAHTKTKESTLPTQ